MNSINEARTLTARFDEARNELETFFAPHLKAWLELETEAGNLTKLEASQDFKYSHTTDEGVIFESEAWEETWQYGGHEYHYGSETLIPFGFIDNPEKFIKEVALRKEQAELRKQEQEHARKLAEVKRAQLRLEQAQADLEASK